MGEVQVTPPDPAREAAILARCEAATPGPWGTDLYYVTGMVPGARPGGEVLVQCRPTVTGLRGYQQPLQEANAAFIAYAREDVPWLLAQLAAARARAERAEGAIVEAIRDAWREHFDGDLRGRAEFVMLYRQKYAALAARGE